jgi:hypothetical protein
VSAEQYRSWPVFLRLQTDKDFQAAFQEVFGEQFIRFEVMAVTTEGSESAGGAEREGNSLPGEAEATPQGNDPEEVTVDSPEEDSAKIIH